MADYKERRARYIARRVAAGLEPTVWRQAVKLARRHVSRMDAPADERSSWPDRNHGMRTYSKVARRAHRVPYHWYVSAFNQLKAGATEPMQPLDNRDLI